MRLLSHRGYWRNPSEKNTVAAFRRSFDLKFGTETDIRDRDGRIVVSHDPAKNDAMPIETLLACAGVDGPMLALNIKSDGLAALVRDAMRSYDRDSWFVFDMSIPDTLQHLRTGNPVYLRVSEYERDEGLLDRADGIWLDAFETDSWRFDIAERYLDQGLNVCMVSPELHGRPALPFWDKLLAHQINRCGTLILCTDEPEQAARYFGEGRD